jgi:Dimerisation domain
MPHKLTTAQHELVGPWNAHLTFRQGPRAGMEESVLLTFLDDGVITHADEVPLDNGPLPRGIGEWAVQDSRLSYWFHVVLTDPSGRPASVVNIRAEGAVAPDRRTFTAAGTGEVYAGRGTEPVATHHVDVRATRAAAPDPARQQVMRMIQAYWLSQICAASARLRLPDHLAGGPRSVSQLASVTAADSDGLGRLLRAAATVGLFAEIEPDRFELTPLGAQLRDVGHAGSLRDLAIA